ncbi:hypothetical protein H8959_008183 [Pygathrix nigripes]
MILEMYSFECSDKQELINLTCEICGDHSDLSCSLQGGKTGEEERLAIQQQRPSSAEIPGLASHTLGRGGCPLPDVAPPPENRGELGGNHAVLRTTEERARHLQKHLLTHAGSRAAKTQDSNTCLALAIPPSPDALTRAAEPTRDHFRCTGNAKLARGKRKQKLHNVRLGNTAGERCGKLRPLTLKFREFLFGRGRMINAAKWGKHEHSPPLPPLMQSSFPPLGTSQGSAHPESVDESHPGKNHLRDHGIFPARCQGAALSHGFLNCRIRCHLPTLQHC